MLDKNRKTIMVQELDNNNSNFGSLHMNTIYIKLYSVFQLHEIVILSQLRGCYTPPYNSPPPPFFSLPLSIYRLRERGSPCPVSSQCRAGWRGAASVQPPQSTFAGYGAPVFSSAWWQGMWGYGWCQDLCKWEGKQRQRVGKKDLNSSSSLPLCAQGNKENIVVQNDTVLFFFLRKGNEFWNNPKMDYDRVYPFYNFKRANISRGKFSLHSKQNDAFLRCHLQKHFISRLEFQGSPLIVRITFFCIF